MNWSPPIIECHMRAPLAQFRYNSRSEHMRAFTESVAVAPRQQRSIVRRDQLIMYGLSLRICLANNGV